jgi:hypothetical protein
MSLKKYGIIGVLVLSPSLVFAKGEQPKTGSPEYFAKALSSQLKASLEVMSDPEIIKANAKYIKTLYDALIAEGFTKEQSLKLVTASLSSKK